MTYDYLKDQAANPMFEKIADIIKENNLKSIVDLGCGYSRVNEFLDDYDYTLVGVDNEPSVVDELLKTYMYNHNIEFHLWDINDWLVNAHNIVLNIQHSDCVILSGILYYYKKDAIDVIEKIIEKINPKMIIICEPRQSVVYKSSNLFEIFSTWAYEAFSFDLDIRMGKRVVYALETDKKRSIFDRKIKANFNNNSIHDHAKQPDFDSNVLSDIVYITNTEALDLAKSDSNHYISVCAGYKSLYQACLDWEPDKQFRFTYIDVVPTAVDYRMYFDQMYPLFGNPDRVLEEYVREINPSILPIYGKDDHKNNLDKIVKQQYKSLGITDKEWKDFIQAYAVAPKSYIRLDAVNNIKLLNKMIAKYDTAKWFWYSNIHDWHQFRFDESTYNNWITYLEQRNNIKFNGKVPPFTST